MSSGTADGTNGEDCGGLGSGTGNEGGSCRAYRGAAIAGRAMAERTPAVPQWGTMGEATEAAPVMTMGERIVPVMVPVLVLLAVAAVGVRISNMGREGPHLDERNVARH